VDPRDQESAEALRALVQHGPRNPSRFRDALLRISPIARDGCVDFALGITALPQDDGRDLPRGCVPYLPCSVDTLLRLVDQAPVRASDVFVDIGSGVGRAAALVSLLTGAPVVGLEIQRAHVSAARQLAARLNLARVSFVEGDAVELTTALTTGSTFFLYCPFSGDRLARVLASLETVARGRAIRICCVDLPLPPLPWLTPAPPLSLDLAIYRSTLHQPA
jgi:SAM-dependent methyltransferase